LKREDDPKCDSRDYWWPAIKNIAERFEEALNKKGNSDSVFVQLNTESFDLALRMYERGWWNFKEHVYGEAAEEARIDRHKIIALYILSFLAKRPFSVGIHPENKKAAGRLFLANELFSLEVMLDLLYVWSKDSRIFNISENERNWFVILLNHFKLKMIGSKPPFISDKPDDMADFLSLAQIIYYIEKSYIG
jgi:hypothetical protein